MTADAPVRIFLHPVGLDVNAVSFIDVPDLRSCTQPGHFPRRRARPGLTLDDIADEILGWTDGQVDLIGASLGGMVALHAALNFPDRIRSLVLACTSAAVDHALMEERARVTEERGGADMREETLQRWFMASTLAEEPVCAGVQYARERLSVMPTGALADTWRAIAGHDVLDRLGEITVPVTLIAGRYDVSSPPAGLEAMADRLNRSRLVMLDAAHMAFLERPGEFSDAVRSHFTWVETAAPRQDTH